MPLAGTWLGLVFSVRAMAMAMAMAMVMAMV